MTPFRLALVLVFRCTNPSLGFFCFLHSLLQTREIEETGDLDGGVERGGLSEHEGGIESSLELFGFARSLNELE